MSSFAGFAILGFLASHFFAGAEVALSTYCGALRVCDDKCAARASGLADFRGKSLKKFWKMRISSRRRAALLFHGRVGKNAGCPLRRGFGNVRRDAAFRSEEHARRRSPSVAQWRSA